MVFGRVRAWIGSLWVRWAEDSSNPATVVSVVWSRWNRSDLFGLGLGDRFGTDLSGVPLSLVWEYRRQRLLKIGLGWDARWIGGGGWDGKVRERATW